MITVDQDYWPDYQCHLVRDTKRVTVGAIDPDASLLVKHDSLVSLLVFGDFQTKHYLLSPFGDGGEKINITRPVRECFSDEVTMTELEVTLLAANSPLAQALLGESLNAFVSYRGSDGLWESAMIFNIT